MHLSLFWLLHYISYLGDKVNKGSQLIKYFLHFLENSNSYLDQSILSKSKDKKYI